MPRTGKLISKALTKLAVELGADLAADKTLDKIRQSRGDKQVRKHSNVGKKDRRHGDDEDDHEDDDSEDEQAAQQRRRRRNSSSNTGPPPPPRHRYYDDDDDRSYRRAPPPLITAPGPSGSRSNGHHGNGHQLLQPAPAPYHGAYAYDEYGNPYPVAPVRRSGSGDQRSRTSSAHFRSGSTDDSLPRPRRLSSKDQDRPHVAFADEVDERERAERPIRFRSSQQNQQVKDRDRDRDKDGEPRVNAPPALPGSIATASMPAPSRSASGASSQDSAGYSTSPISDTKMFSPSSHGPSKTAGIPLREAIQAARCALHVYSLTTQQQAEAFLRSAESAPHRPQLLDVIFDSPTDHVRNCAMFRRRNDSVLFLAVRGSGRKGSEWATEMFRNVVSGASSLQEVIGLLLQDGSMLYAHAGLLQNVIAMVRQIIDLLEKRAAKAASYGTPRLIITGHSSGGAIASLIYIMLEHNYQHILDRFRTIHCIAFGAPPCVRAQDVITSRPHDGLFTFVMKGDPIPRMDLAYAKDILDKYPLQVSALYSSTPFAAPGPGPSLGATSSASQDVVESTLLSIATAVAGKNVETPKQTVVPAGKLMLLDPLETDMWDMSPEYLEESAFYNPAVHPMPVYLQCLERLEAAHPDITLD